MCREILEKTTFDYLQEGVDAPILAVVDPDPDAPGVLYAKELGLLTFSDYHSLYDSRYNIHLIIILTPGQKVFDEILASRPPRIRIMSYAVFDIFWNAIGSEERKLREQKSAMETVLNGIQDSILVLTPEMEIIEVNDSFLNLSGSSREDVIGSKCHQVYSRLNHRCDDVDLICPLEDVVRNQEHTRQIRTREGKDGKLRHFEVNVYPIWEKSGKISKFIHISRDVTQRLKEEEEITRRLEQMVEERTLQLRETHAKLLHQDKMASLGKLSASVVHEINNPIAGILNLVMLIHRIIDEDQLQDKDLPLFRQYLNLMETETRRISRIVTNLLAFSRPKTAAVSSVKINQLIERTLILNANLLKVNQVKVTKHFDSDLPDMTGSEDQLQQVFMNMISNAVEAMEAQSGGVLDIVTTCSAKDDRIIVKFTDTGTGIPKEDFSKLFEPFFSTKTDGKGVGLGLSVAYGIVKEHGGSIFVESGQGIGTTFRLTLPRSSVEKPLQGGIDGGHENSDRR